MTPFLYHLATRLWDITHWDWVDDIRDRTISPMTIPLRCRLGFQRRELVDKSYETETTYVHRVFARCVRCPYYGMMVEGTSTHKFTGKVVKMI